MIFLILCSRRVAVGRIAKVLKSTHVGSILLAKADSTSWLSQSANPKQSQVYLCRISVKILVALKRHHVGSEGLPVSVAKVPARERDGYISETY